MTKASKKLALAAACLLSITLLAATIAIAWAGIPLDPDNRTSFAITNTIGLCTLSYCAVAKLTTN